VFLNTLFLPTCVICGIPERIYEHEVLSRVVLRSFMDFLTKVKLLAVFAAKNINNRIIRY